MNIEFCRSALLDCLLTHQMYPEEKKKQPKEPHGYVYISTKRRTSLQIFKMQVILYTILRSTEWKQKSTRAQFYNTRKL